MNSISNKMNVRVGQFMAMILSFVFLVSFEANATHIVGGELSYNIVGFERVQFKLIVRRDCEFGDPEADYDDPAYIGVFDLDGNPVTNPIYGFINGRIEIALNPADTLSEPFMSCGTSNNDEVCVQEATYRITRNLQPHPSGGYIFAYQRCCRNSSLTNVLDPLNTGMTLVSTITNEAIATQNKSPELPEFPRIYACVGSLFSSEQGLGVTDPDGDELRYRLNTPNIGATNADPYPSNPSAPPYDPVQWETDYSVANFLNTTPPLTIDPSTGEITVTPDAVGQYLVSFCVEEYRDGRLFNTTCREFEINTRPCGDIAVANIVDVPSPQCDDLTVDFSSAGSEGDVFEWDFDDGSEISMDENPTHVFPDTGCYTITLLVTNSTSGCFEADSIEICFLETGVVQNDFGIEMLECVDTLVVKVTDQNTYDTLNPIVSMTWGASIGALPIAADSGSMFTFGLPTSAEVTICQYINLENGCMIENCQTVELNLLELDFEDDVILCLEEEAMIFVNHAVGDDITVVWEENDIIVSEEDNGQKLTVLTNDSIVTTLYFTATNEYGCSTSDSINITTAGKRPGLSFLVFQECGSLKISLENTSTDSVPVMWDFGDTNTSTEWEPMHEYAAGGTYTISLSGGTFPCDSTYSITIEIPIETIELPDTVYQCFGDSLTLNEGGNADWEYVWSPSELFSNPNAVSPKVLVTEVTTVYVMITVFDGENYCEHNDSIVVFPVPDFQFDLDPAAGDITVCGGEDSSIQLTVQTMEGVVVTWKDANGTVLHEGDTFNVDLADGLNQFTVMGVYMGIEECMKTESFNITLNRIELTIDVINISTGMEMFCVPDTGKLIVNVDGPAGEYTYQWEPMDGVISGADNDSLCVFVDETITYCVTVTNIDLDCSAEACYTINFGAEVTLTLLNEGVICAGDTVKVNAVVAPDDLDCTIGWSVPGTIVGPEDQLTVCYIAGGTGEVTAAVGCVGGCTDMASIVVEVLDLSSLISISADPEIVESDDQNVQLDAVGGDLSWTYSWTGPNIDNPTRKDPMSIMPGRGSHDFSVMVVDTNGCEGMATLRTPEPPDLPCEHPYVFVPNAFSPNGDGINEVLEVRGVQITEIVEFFIYNRWGQEVFRVNNSPTAVWDGTYLGDPLEADVYGYYIRVTCEGEREDIQQGNISILR